MSTGAELFETACKLYYGVATLGPYLQVLCDKEKLLFRPYGNYYISMDSLYAADKFSMPITISVGSCSQINDRIFDTK